MKAYPATFPADPDNPNRLSTAGMLAALESHDEMTWSIARKWHATNPRVPLPDLHEEVVFAFKLAALKFDPSRGWKFGTYAYTCATNHLSAFCRRENAQGMHVPESQPVHYQPSPRPIREAWQEPARPTDNLDPELRADLGSGFWEWATRDLSERQRQAVLGIYRDDKNQVEIGAEVNLSKARVGQHLDAAIVQLRGRADLRELAREIA